MNTKFIVPLETLVIKEPKHLIKAYLQGCTMRFAKGILDNINLIYMDENKNSNYYNHDADENFTEGIFNDKETYLKGEYGSFGGGNDFFEISALEVLKEVVKADFNNNNQMNCLYVIDENNGVVREINDFFIKLDIINDLNVYYSNIKVFEIKNDRMIQLDEFFLSKDMAVNFTSVKVTENGITEEKPSLADNIGLNDLQKSLFNEFKDLLNKFNKNNMEILFNEEENDLIVYNNDTKENIDWFHCDESNNIIDIKHFASIIPNYKITICNNDYRPMIKKE